MSDVTPFLACNIEGCARNAHRKAWGARGMCLSHYKRQRRHGDPSLGRRPVGEIDAWIEALLEEDPSECVLWPFSKIKDTGYAVLARAGTSVSAGRYICEKVKGTPPTPKHEAAHSCGNGNLACVTPRHLSWKTHAENIADKFEHGTIVQGDAHPFSKLTAETVLEIRASTEKLKVLAEKYGVEESTISMARRGLNWKSVGSEQAA